MCTGKAPAQVQYRPRPSAITLSHIIALTDKQRGVPRVEVLDQTNTRGADAAVLTWTIAAVLEGLVRPSVGANCVMKRAKRKSTEHRGGRKSAIDGARVRSNERKTENRKDGREGENGQRERMERGAERERERERERARASKRGQDAFNETTIQ